MPVLTSALRHVPNKKDPGHVLTWGNLPSRIRQHVRSMTGEEIVYLARAGHLVIAQRSH
jgi:hypothetical protein